MHDEHPTSNWREPIDRGIHCVHSRACRSSRDRQGKRRCQCPYEIRYQRPDGSSTSRTMSCSLTAAREFKERQNLDGKRQRREHHAALATVTVRELFAMWMRYGSTKRRPWKPGTLQLREQAYRKIDPALGGVLLTQLTPGQLTDWARHLADNDPHHRSNEIALQTLSTMLNFAVEREDLGIARNPARKVELPEQKDRNAGGDRRRTLSADEVSVLLSSASKSSDAALLHCAVEGGLRRGELAALRWMDIEADFMGGPVIHVRQRIWQRCGHVDVGEPKSRRARVVPITRACHEALVQYRKQCIDDGIDTHPESWVWRGRGVRCKGAPRTTERFMTPDGMSGRLTRLIKRAGLVRDDGRALVTAHGLRATAATMAYQRNVPVLAIQSMLGHVGQRMTEHYIDVRTKATMDLFRDAFEPADNRPD